MTSAPFKLHQHDRLWRALASRTTREQPARGFDLAGERLRALLSRRKAGIALRRRAERIIDHATRLRNHGERALDELIIDVRDPICAAHNHTHAIDDALAVACEVVRREIGLSLHPEQIIGAIVLLDNRVAEMATGEGKTVTAILPASILAWHGRGVHVITVNDYLARRDAEITGPAYRRLGLSVGVLQNTTPHHERRAAYECAVTYAADKEVIFDFLRDRLVSPLHPRLVPLLLEQVAGEHGAQTPGWNERVVQRGLYAAIVDEADNVLIDEAITPAIIGMDLPAEATAERSAHYIAARDVAAALTNGKHYRVDQRMRAVTLTDTGRARIAELASSLPPFWAGPRRREELVTQALVARELYRNGDEYIVKDGQIVIVDHATGRLLEGRKWQLGLHQAVEAKENLDVTEDRRTTARVSYQRFFQQYRRLSGMTGTAWEVADELWEYYRLPVVRIPTHKPVIRERLPDRVYTSESRKFEAVARRVAEYYKRRRPVLVGTRSVEASERLGQLLASYGVPVRILNAVREAEEAEIVAIAGKAGAVTVATNMAGRGTDIILDAESRALGGLVVIATERHNEARVDRQLFGRSGRQGDPGRAEVFVSLEDPLIREHALKPLVALCRAASSPRPLASLLWRSAQWSAGRKAAAARRRNANIDAWLDLALHEHYR